VGLGSKASGSPMAARVQPARVRAALQSIHHFVAKSEWSDNAILAAVHARVLRGPIRALIIDDTAIPKKGKHSVDGARQYCWQLGNETTARSR
jgi:SRSO17 transposase